MALARLSPLLVGLFAAGAAHAQDAPAPDAAPASDIDATAAIGDDGPAGVWSVAVENDLFGPGTDKNYTNGIRLSWTSERIAPPDLWRGALRLVTQTDSSADLRWGLSLGQNLYTPEDISIATPDPSDRPYAAWLRASIYGIIETGRTLDTLEFSAGVIGPSALGKETQKFVHDIINDQDPKGWDSQLKDEPALQLTYDKKWRALLNLEEKGGGLGFDLTPSATAALGTVNVYGAAGLMARFGSDLDSDFGPPRIRPAPPGSGFFNPRDEFSWYLFAGIEGRVIGRDAFLDGNLWRESPSIDKRRWMAEGQAGLALHYGDWRMAYTFVARTPQFQGQGDGHRFGGVTVSFRY